MNIANTVVFDNPRPLTQVLSAVVAGLIIGGAISAVSTEAVIPLIVVFFGILLGGFVILNSHPEDHRFLITVFLGTYLLRIALSAVIFFLFLSLTSNVPSTSSGFMIGDAFAYSHNGWWIAQQWQKGFFPDERAIIKHGMSNTVTNYDYWSAMVYYVVDKSPLTLMFINCLAGALTVLLVYLIALQIFGRKSARTACGLCAFWPSLVFWSSQNLKEPVAIFLIGLIIYSVMSLRVRLSAWHLGITATSFLALAYWHRYMVIILGAAVVVSFILYSDSYKKNLVILSIVLFLLFLFFLSRGSSIGMEMFKSYAFFETFSQFEQINYLRSVRSFGASALFPGLDISNPQRLFFFLPAGTLFVWLVPFPWKVGGSLMSAMSCPEMLIWYFLIPSALRGLSFSLREKWQKASLIIIFLAFSSIVLALIEGNVGTLFRHRSMALPWTLILTAAGMNERRKVREAS